MNKTSNYAQMHFGHQATKRNRDTWKKTCKKTLSLPFSVLRKNDNKYCDLSSSAITDSHNTILAKVQAITGPLLKYVYMSCFIHKQKPALSTLCSEPTRALNLC